MSAQRFSRVGRRAGRTGAVARAAILALAAGSLVMPWTFAQAASPTSGQKDVPAQPPAASEPAPSTGFAPLSRDDARDPVKAMKDCMAAWDAGTRMTKREWEATCRRTLPDLQPAPSAKEPSKKKKQGALVDPLPHSA